MNAKTCRNRHQMMMFALFPTTIHASPHLVTLHIPLFMAKATGNKNPVYDHHSRRTQAHCVKVGGPVYECENSTNFVNTRRGANEMNIKKHTQSTQPKSGHHPSIHAAYKVDEYNNSIVFVSTLRIIATCMSCVRMCWVVGEKWVVATREISTL